MFNSNLVDFVTGRRDGVYRAGSDGAARLTLPELIGYGSIKAGGNYGANPSAGYDGLVETLTTNFKSNWGSIAVGVIVLPIAANAFMKIVRKPLILPANRMISKYISKEVKV